MSYILVFLIPVIASAVGSIVGAGGGVIIKPVLDSTGLMSVSALSFCSGCTVLCMSLSSLFRNRNNGIKLDKIITVPLAIGAAAGGLLGKKLFQITVSTFGNDRILGAIQSGTLAVMLIAVLIYLLNKKRIKPMDIRSQAASGIIGLVLGLASSYVGIGGGPMNVAVLFYFYSMNAKTASKNSIFVILCSQAVSIFMNIIDGTVPDFNILYMILMVSGGVIGALIGSEILKKIDNSAVEKLLLCLDVIIILIALKNMYAFLK